MAAKPLNKRILVLGLLLIIIVIGGIFVWQNYDVGKDYFDWLKSVFSKLNPFTAKITPESLLSEDSGLDLSEVNLETLLLGEETTPEVEKREGLEGEEGLIITSEVKVPPEAEISLIEIQEKIDEIGEKTEEISREVDKLLTLTKIQGEIDEIGEKVEEISRGIEELTKK